MTKREIATLACRILSLYAVVRALAHLRDVLLVVGIDLWRHEGDPAFALFWKASSALLPFFLFLGGAAALWLLAKPLAARMVSDDGAATAQCKIDPGEAQAVAFSVVGLCVLMGALTRLGYAIANLLLVRTGEGLMPEGPFASQVADLIALIVHIALGLVLLLRARGLAALLRRIRTAGWEKRPPPPD